MIGNLVSVFLFSAKMAHIMGVFVFFSQTVVETVLDTSAGRKTVRTRRTFPFLVVRRAAIFVGTTQSCIVTTLFIRTQRGNEPTRLDIGGGTTRIRSIGIICELTRRVRVFNAYETIRRYGLLRAQFNRSRCASNGQQSRAGNRLRRIGFPNGSSLVVHRLPNSRRYVGFGRGDAFTSKFSRRGINYVLINREPVNEQHPPRPHRSRCH